MDRLRAKLEFLHGKLYDLSKQSFAAGKLANILLIDNATVVDGNMAFLKYGP